MEKQSSRQVQISSDQVSLTSLSPEALQTQYKACVLLLSMVELYLRTTGLQYSSLLGGKKQIF